MIWVRQADGAWVARYGYDPLGRRIWKEQYRDGAGLPLAQPKRSYYLYNEEGLLAEARQAIALNAEGLATASAAPALHTQYGPQPDAPFTTALLLAKTLDSNAQQQLVFFHNDHLGAPVQATNAKGQVLWAAVYEPFGQATILSPAPTAEQPVVEINLRLPGQYWDDEARLHYNFHRTYAPNTGRYAQSDPIGLRGGINMYAYVGGSPMGMVDPEGRIAAVAIPLLTPVVVRGVIYLASAAAAAWAAHKATQSEAQSCNEKPKCKAATPENIRVALESSNMLTMQPTVSAGHI
ncbi:RHS domain-containing protein [Mitsuaria sp. WAJ17]|nr:RHS domain-containing protein [Mitsuaria sp. WAJ17]